MPKTEVTDIAGNKKVIECMGCAIQKGEVQSPGGLIAESRYFTAGQDYEIPILGFVIVASKRHIQSIDEFTDDEQKDFIEFLCRVRKAMRQALGIEVVYLIQEEDTSNHFHIWMFPRYGWMQEKFGAKIESVHSIMEYARTYLKIPENLKGVSEATKKLRDYFEK